MRLYVCMCACDRVRVVYEIVLTYPNLSPNLESLQIRYFACISEKFVSPLHHNKKQKHHAKNCT